MSRVRKPLGAGGDGVSSGKRISSKRLPLLFKGSLGAGIDGEQRLPAVARTRIGLAAREQGEAWGLLQEQAEWLRMWLHQGRIEPKDALTVWRGISKVLEQIEGRTEGEPVSVTFVMGEPAPLTTGDQIIIH